LTDSPSTSTGGGETAEAEKREHEAFKYAVAVRELEIKLFWQRSLFFWGFVAASFAGFLNAGENGVAKVAISAVGLVASVGWALVNLGSKWWQGNWEIKVEKHEKTVVGCLFRDRTAPTRFDTNIPLRRYSVSEVAFYISIFISLIWLLILLYEVYMIYSKIQFDCTQFSIAVLMAITAIVFCVIMERFTYRPNQPTKKDDCS
jgi:hypothetical protein